MPSTLPSLSTLFKDAWTLFTDTWNEMLKVTRWFIYIGFVYFGIGVLLKISDTSGVRFLTSVLTLLILVVTLWTIIRTLRAGLHLEAGNTTSETPEEQRNALNLILPFLWVAFLQILMIVGGFIALILPGIYLLFSLSFSPFLLIEENIRGTAALSASRALVKGRWWSTAWRIFVGQLVSGIALIILAWLLALPLQSIYGQTALNTFTVTNTDPLAQGMIALLQSVLQAAFIPLILFYQIKLYRALKKTR